MSSTPFLAICIVLACISKDILIFNEELLVAVCFVCFVVFTARFLSQTLYDNLTSTVNLQIGLQSHLAYLAEWYNYYSLRSTHYKESIKMIGFSCMHHILQRSKQLLIASVYNTTKQQCISQFKTLSSARVRDQLQVEIVRRFQNQLRFAELRKIQTQLVRHSISLLKQKQRR